MILKMKLEKQKCDDLERIQLAPDSAQCQVLENGDESSRFVRGDTGKYVGR